MYEGEEVGLTGKQCVVANVENVAWQTSKKCDSLSDDDNDNED